MTKDAFEGMQPFGCSVDKSNSLTLEEQKRLTEFLGECYHVKWVDHTGFCSTVCAHCGKILDELVPIPRLDFSDWRVVGRLIEKTRGIDLWDNKLTGLWACDTPSLREHIGRGSREQETPQLAICRAVLAYLKESDT